MKQFSTKIAAFVLAVTLFAGSIANGQDLFRENGYYRATVKKTFEPKSGIGLDVDADEADVQIIGWNKKTIEVEETLHFDTRDENSARSFLDRSQTRYSERSTSIRVFASGYREIDYQSFIIRVPRATEIRVDLREGDVFVQEVEGELILRTSNGDVELEQIRGDIDIHTSSGDITIDGAIGKVEANTSGGDIRLENIEGDIDGNTSGGSIRLRMAKSNSYLNTSGGDIDLENITGKIDANTSGGSIEVRVCEGPIRVLTSGGDIDFDTITGPISATTHGGDIVGDRIEDRVTASTNGGDIELTRVNGAVRAETDAGEIDVEITMTDFSKEHDITLRTRIGDIRLLLPKKIPASISARIWRESRRWSDHNIESDFPLPVRESDNGKQVTMEGDINGGGDIIELETSHGDIVIERGR